MPRATRRAAASPAATDAVADANSPARTAAPPSARAARRAAIVQVAYRLIAERGLEGLRFGDVAREAGINNGTLLYYFPSKDALIEAVGAFVLHQFSQTSQPPQDAHAALDPLAQLRWEFADARERLHDPAAVVYTELLARAQRDPSVAAVLRNIDAAWHGWLSHFLERARQSGVFRVDMDVSLVAATIMAATRGVSVQTMVGTETPSAETVMDAVAELIERWIAPAPIRNTRRPRKDGRP